MGRPLSKKGHPFGQLCLLVNFGEKPLGVRRFVHTPKKQG